MRCFVEFCTGIVLWGDVVVKCCEVQFGWSVVMSWLCAVK